MFAILFATSAFAASIELLEAPSGSVVADNPLIDSLDFSLSRVSTTGTLNPGIYESFLSTEAIFDEQSSGFASGSLDFRLSTIGDGETPTAIPSPTAAAAGFALLTLLGRHWRSRRHRSA